MVTELEKNPGLGVQDESQAPDVVVDVPGEGTARGQVRMDAAQPPVQLRRSQTEVVRPARYPK